MQGKKDFQFFFIQDVDPKVGSCFVQYFDDCAIRISKLLFKSVVINKLYVQPVNAKKPNVMIYKLQLSVNLLRYGYGIVKL